jgi:hypothetical protein
LAFAALQEKMMTEPPLSTESEAMASAMQSPTPAKVNVCAFICA